MPPPGFNQGKNVQILSTTPMPDLKLSFILNIMDIVHMNKQKRKKWSCVVVCMCIDFITVWRLVSLRAFEIF